MRQEVSPGWFKWFQIFYFIFCLSSSMLFSIELKPWFDPMFELQTRTTPVVQLYRSIQTKEGLQKYAAGDLFLDFELYTTLLQNWSVELEAMGADTRAHTFSPDSFSLTGRYLWFDDVVGDPLSLTTGVSLYKVFRPARRDLSIFHHGGIELEFHAAAGKEVSCHAYWVSRGWLVVGIGVADLGAPWLRFDTHWEHQWRAVHHLRLSLLSVFGLGSRSLKSVSHFHGYGPIQHYSIDLGLRYSYLLDHNISLSAEYAHRVYAHSCPIHVNFIIFSLDYPLNL